MMEKINNNSIKILENWRRKFSQVILWDCHIQFSSVQFNRSVVSDSLHPHGLQHARPPCLSPTQEFTQTHIHWISDAIQPSHPLLSPSPPALWRRQWQPTPVLLPGKSHGWRSLLGCGPWGREESDTTERLHFHFSLSCTGEGNDKPLQYSCLENPRDGSMVGCCLWGHTESDTTDET